LRLKKERLYREHLIDPSRDSYDFTKQATHETKDWEKLYIDKNQNFSLYGPVVNA
jgi:hypothetical protein